MKVTVRKRLTMWRTPRFKAFTPEGITLGATVTDGYYTGQVWAASPRRKCWWVVLPNQQAVEMYESDMRVLGQCVAQLTLADVAA